MPARPDCNYSSHFLTCSSTLRRNIFTIDEEPVPWEGSRGLEERASLYSDGIDSQRLKRAERLVKQ